MGQTSINIRMDADLKAQFEALCSNLGMNMSTAVNIFAKAMIRKQGIPFDVCMVQPSAAAKDTTNTLNCKE